MATTDRMPSTSWVDDRLRALDPPAVWEPAAGVALARFRERVSAPPRTPLARPWVWLLASSLVCVLVVMVPGTRAVAQRLWDVFWVGRMEFLQVDVDKLPGSLTESKIRIVGPNTQVATPVEAAQHAGFAPRLPSASVVSGDLSLHVLGAWSLEFTVKADDLQTALWDAGLSDLHIPPAWDGARISLHTSQLVAADYLDVQLLQCLPPALTTPPGFEFGAFTETLLRIVGLSPAQARAFGTQMAAAPGLFVLFSPEDHVSMRHVRLRTGQGTLLHEPSEDGGFGRTTLVWNVPDRLYMLSASGRFSDDHVMAVANSIP